MVRRVFLLLVVFAGSVAAQPATRRATNLAALVAHPDFYNGRPVVVVGDVKLQDNGELRVTTDGTSMRLVTKGSAPDGIDEIRGEFWDLGRMGADSPKLAGYDIKATFKIDPEGAWPRPGQVTAIVANAITAAQAAAAPSVRNIVLYPSRYLDQRITITGQFGGRNLLGDLPDAPGLSRYDFVLRSADAAIWITNLRPRGKDFELSLDARIDTGRWLEVSGTLQQGRGLQWLDGTSGTIKITQAPKETTEDAPIRIPMGPPPEVVFSAPTSEETDVQLATSVRIQFSRDINPATFKGNIAVKYSEAETRERGEPDTPKIEFTNQYLPGTRVLELKFANPLERFRTVTVQLSDGILGSDKQPLKPWTLNFQTGP
ncbi:MAG TPA: Ig-like domain-containing protein [Vicinamibacterales bacterium]